MAEDINNSGKDTSKVLSDGIRTHFNTQNTALSSVDDIQKWYAQQQAQLLESTETSRLSTATENPDIEGLATVEEKTEGLQTYVEDIDENEQTDSEVVTSKLQTKANKDNQEKSSNSKLSTKVNENNELDDESIELNNENDTNNSSQLQTKVGKSDKINKISKNTSKVIKVKKGVNKFGNAIARTGSRLQTLTTDSDGSKGFADDLKYGVGKTTQKVAKFATKKVRLKVSMKMTQLVAKITKVVVKAVVKAAKALVSFIIETAPVSIPVIAILLVVIIICAVIGGFNPIFGDNSSNETIDSYVSYISNYESEHSVDVDWCVPLAYIYALDDNIQYDAGEQYLLNKFDEEGLLTSMSSSTDYKRYFSSHSDTVLEFYSKSGINSNEIDLDEWYNFVKDIEKEPDDFMSLVDKRLEDYETSYTGTGNGKFIYPTTTTQISAGYPNYSDGSYHGGIDFPVSLGTNVGATADGIVVISTALRNSDGSYRSYGEYIAIDHGNGVRSYYCHLSSRSVNVGDTIKQGQIIGKSGSTGNSTGPHLHFEIRVNNTRVNPMPYLEQNY